MKWKELLHIHVGDCLETMRRMPDGIVQTCVTSPPYFGLRDYGHEQQIGLEETPAAYVAKLVSVFREVRRVLRDDGTLWLNLGDSYAGSRAGPQGVSGHFADHSVDASRARSASPEMIIRGKRDAKRWGGGNSPCGGGLKPKDLIGIPWRVAFALQDDGWYLRQDIIWHKPNPMPESVKDRCTKAHEYLFLLTKSKRYYFDSDAMSEPASGMAPGNVNPQKAERAYADGDERHRTKGGLTAYAERQRSRRNSFSRETKYSEGDHGQKPQARTDRENISYEGRRNRRSVWSVATRPYKGAHFATFPPALVEPCILAGSRPGDVVLDPFGGSGTTASVAIKHARHAVLCELNPSYAALVDGRVQSVMSERARRPRRPVPPRDSATRDMFEDHQEAPAP